MREEQALEDWLDRQMRISARRMAAAISATGLVKRRPGFGQRIVPAPGSVVASPVLADYDPDPDYFFHWLRDSALVMDAVVQLATAGDPTQDWPRHFRDFVDFSAALDRLTGADLLAGGSPRDRAQPAFLQFVRPDEDLAGVDAGTIRGEVRFNPDGSLDTIRWGRPQYDGVALRALVLMRGEAAGLGGATTSGGALWPLLRSDLDFTAAHAGTACIDLWEDAAGRHYHTMIVQVAALLRGASRVATADPETAARWRGLARDILPLLDACWSDAEGSFVSRVRADSEAAPRPDVAVLLGVLHAAVDGGRHSVQDPRILATLERLEAIFSAEYPINAGLPAGAAPALGRFAGDAYYSGGAYHFATLAAAEFHYRRSRTARSPTDADRHRVRGDAYLATVRRHVPDDGALAEQFDRTTGAPASAKDLAWSHAALVTAALARRAAIGHADGRRAGTGGAG